MLEIYNPKHQDSDANGWVALTADAPFPVNTGIFKFRDAAADATVNPYVSADVDLRTIKKVLKAMTYGVTAGSATISAGNIAAAFAFDGADAFLAQGTDNAAYFRATPRVTAGALTNGNLFGHAIGIYTQRFRFTSVNAALGTGTFDLYVTASVGDA